MRDDLLLPIIVAVLAGRAEGQPHAYPLYGQSVASQHRDETACSKWASTQSGYDPTQRPTAPVAPAGPATGGGSLIKGASAGSARRAPIRQAADAGNVAAAQQAPDPQASYYRARKACLGSRGYIAN